MNENVVLERIITDAENESKQIIADANKEIENMQTELSVFEKSLEEKSNNEVEKYRVEGKEFYASNLEFNKSKLILETKNSVLHDLKKSAISRIKSYEKDKILYFLNKILLNNAEKDETLIFNVDNISEKDLKNLEAVKSLNLILLEDKSIEKGMILSTETYDKNLSFESIVSDLFDKKLNEICEVLF